MIGNIHTQLVERIAANCDQEYEALLPEEIDRLTLICGEKRLGCIGFKSSVCLKKEKSEKGATVDSKQLDKPLSLLKSVKGLAKHGEIMDKPFCCKSGTSVPMGTKLRGLFMFPTTKPSASYSHVHTNVLPGNKTRRIETIIRDRFRSKLNINAYQGGQS